MIVGSHLKTGDMKTGDVMHIPTLDSYIGIDCALYVFSML